MNSDNIVEMTKTSNSRVEYSAEISTTMPNGRGVRLRTLLEAVATEHERELEEQAVFLAGEVARLRALLDLNDISGRRFSSFSCEVVTPHPHSQSPSDLTANFGVARPESTPPPPPPAVEPVMLTSQAAEPLALSAPDKNLDPTKAIDPPQNLQTREESGHTVTFAQSLQAFSEKVESFSLPETPAGKCERMVTLPGEMVHFERSGTASTVLGERSQHIRPGRSAVSLDLIRRGPPSNRKIAQKLRVSVAIRDDDISRGISAQALGIDKSTQRNVFADATAMKEKIRANLGKEEYTVTKFYYDTGIAQAIAKSSLFETITLGVIAFNAFWIAVDTDLNTADTLVDAHPVFVIAENLFCLFFFTEWFIRFMSFRQKSDGLKDAWFVFDTVLAFQMVIETWLFSLIIAIGGHGLSTSLRDASVLKLFRLVRLSRMARMAKLMNAIPELMILIKGMLVAVRSVFFTMLLLVGLLYIFSIIFVQLLGPRGALNKTAEMEDGDNYFPNVLQSMHNLMVGGAMPDQGELINRIGEESFLTYILIVAFVLIAGITIMNMLIGVLCEVVTVVANVEKETLLVSFVKQKLQEMLDETLADRNENEKISRNEFEELLENRDAARALQGVGVDVLGLVDLTDFIFRDNRELSFGEFMDLVLELRGSNTATVKDIVDLRKLVMGEFHVLQECCAINPDALKHAMEAAEEQGFTHANNRVTG